MLANFALTWTTVPQKELPVRGSVLVVNISVANGSSKSHERNQGRSLAARGVRALKARSSLITLGFIRFFSVDEQDVARSIGNASRKGAVAGKVFTLRRSPLAKEVRAAVSGGMTFIHANVIFMPRGNYKDW